MPYDHPEPDDPQMLVGVLLPGDEHTTREMAYTFAEEFARMGYTREQLLALFRNPYYGGAHGAYVTLGDDAINAIVDECVACFAPARVAGRALAPTITASGAPSSRPPDEQREPAVREHDQPGCCPLRLTKER